MVYSESPGATTFLFRNAWYFRVFSQSMQRGVETRQQRNNCAEASFGDIGVIVTHDSARIPRRIEAGEDPLVIPRRIEREVEIYV